jgi:hypothetical protein
VGKVECAEVVEGDLFVDAVAGWLVLVYSFGALQWGRDSGKQKSAPEISR